jgi:hypothetical protein
MFSRGSSSSSGSEYAGNSRLTINLAVTAFELPRIDVEQKRLWELVNESVDVIYPSGPSRANRLVVDVMTYKEMSGGRTVSHFLLPGGHQILHHPVPGIL